MTILNDLSKTNVMPVGMLNTVSGTDETFINILRDKPIPSSTNFLTKKGDHRKRD